MEQPEQTLVRYRTALEEIFHNEGKVCLYNLQDGCAHPGCRSSRFSWEIARAALFPPVIVPLLPPASEGKTS